MVALNACPGRREVVVWASYWRRGRSGNAIGLTKVTRENVVRAQHSPYCSHTEERFSDIWRPHGDLVDSLGRHGRSVVAVLCDGGFNGSMPFISVDLRSQHVIEEVHILIRPAGKLNRVEMPFATYVYRKKVLPLLYQVAGTRT